MWLHDMGNPTDSTLKWGVSDTRSLVAPGQVLCPSRPYNIPRAVSPEQVLHWMARGLSRDLSLLLPDQHEAINVIDQCHALWDVQAAQISLDYITTEGRRINRT